MDTFLDIIHVVKYAYIKIASNVVTLTNIIMEKTFFTFQMAIKRSVAQYEIFAYTVENIISVVGIFNNL